MSTIRAIDQVTINNITAGQVVIDLQTAVKELLENSIDAGATNIEVRFKQYGLSGLEVLDNGSGIAPENHKGIALKHHTSKLSSFSDLDSVSTFGFRGEALSSLCVLCGGATVTTATASMEPKATCLVVDITGKVIKQSSVARPRGTTVSLTKLFSSLAVRRKEFERNIKREFGKALALLTAYALGPCASGTGIRLTVSNQPDKGQKTTPIKTLGEPSFRSSLTALWGNKAEENIVDMDFSFEVERERIKRSQSQDLGSIPIRVRGLMSKFAIGCGRTGKDRQFLYVNGRPCDLPKVAQAINDTYRTFNANQLPFILADFILPTDTYDVNVSPDKRSIFLHSEANLIVELKVCVHRIFAALTLIYVFSRLL
ncbi:histidine kinase-like ATPase [Crepidotus variabilis]|uniref:Histidine kinase-like ATPase n=1 Tax=Crepidotus variabilis TaxID=179855 RepID=A0A9P6EKI7_9AGAR|nr:histidine kinase-like ATPase [Crepidotus variabilis]